MARQLKTDVSELEIFQRTLICKTGLIKFTLPEEEEAEEEEEELWEDLSEEEECEYEEEEEDLCNELYCLKQRVLIMLLKLRQMEDKTPIDFEQLNCSKRHEICASQKTQDKQQCHIDELVRVLRVAREHMKGLFLQLHEKQVQIEQLQKVLHMLKCWTAQQQREFNVCRDRFLYLKRVKSDWKRAQKRFEKQRKLIMHLLKGYYIKDDYMVWKVQKGFVKVFKKFEKDFGQRQNDDDQHLYNSNEKVKALESLPAKKELMQRKRKELERKQKEARKKAALERKIHKEKRMKIICNPKNIPVYYN